MKSYLERMRQRIEDDLLASNRWQFFSPAIYAQFRVTLPIIQKASRGNLLDIGAGRQPYKKLIIDMLTTYDSVDLFDKFPEIKYHLDAQNLEGIDEGKYDIVILTEVLEHIPHPWKALSEANRVLCSNGTIIVTVPHLSRLHDLPHDYYRFTSYGLRVLLEDAGFSDIRILPKGALFCFLGHQMSSLLLTLTWGVPILKDIVFLLNKWFITIPFFYIDSVFKIDTILPLGYIAVGTRK